MKHARTAVFAAIAMVAACTSGPLKVEPPKNNFERAAYLETGAQAAIGALMDLTCRKYQPTGECTEAGRPLHPERSKGYLEQISRVRTAVRAVNSMAGAGGQCLGQPSTPAACLDLASDMLREVEQIIGDIQKLEQQITDERNRELDMVLLQWAHDLGAKDGDDTAEVISSGITDAVRFRALINCSRVRLIGYSRGGPKGQDGPIRHIGFEFTTDATLSGKDQAYAFADEALWRRKLQFEKSEATMTLNAFIDDIINPPGERP